MYSVSSPVVPKLYLMVEMLYLPTWATVVHLRILSVYLVTLNRFRDFSKPL